MGYVKTVLEREINAATDNPLVFWNDEEKLEFLSGGNFHGEPIAFAMDILSMSMAELGNISERRTFFMLDPTLSYGLPPNLAGVPAGLNYGYGIIACSASALVSENKTLCFPASVDNVPTKSNQEDHVSMAPWACRKAKSIIDNTYKVIGIEYMIAAEAISLTKDQLGQLIWERNTGRFQQNKARCKSRLSGFIYAKSIRSGYRVGSYRSHSRIRGRSHR